MAAAAKAFDPATARDALFAASSYLSTTTVLYKEGGFTPAEIERLAAYSEEMSWDVVYAPGMAFDPAEADGVLDDYRQSIFGTGEAPVDVEAEPFDPTTDSPVEEEEATSLPSTRLARLAWQSLMGNVGEDVLGAYVFDARPLTNDRPFFAAYVKPADLGKTLDRLELFQDEWGYLLLWATFAIACSLAALLVLLPMVFAWRTAFAHNPGKAGTILYFACLGLGYIMVEVGLIGRFTLALANPTVSASVLIAGMLVFSGLGSLASTRIIERARRVMPLVFLAIAALLFAYGHLLDPVLDRIGALDYGLRLVISFALVAPPAFLMGFPMAVGMTWLARLGKQGMFIWAWGINGCFSVVGAALVPIVATAFGLAAVLDVSAVAYLLAIPALVAVMRPRRAAAAVPA